MPTATVPCPMKNCKEVLPVLEAKNKRHSPYVACKNWRAVIFLDKTPAGMAWLNGSRSSRENPVQQDRPIRTVYSEGSEEPVVYLEDLE